MFYTNVKEYGPYGCANGSPFSFHMENGVIVGFNGRHGGLIDAIGVHVKKQ